MFGDIGRREAICGSFAAVAMMAIAIPTSAKKRDDTMAEQKATYGLIGQMKAQPGKRDELLAILAEGTTAMPGNIAYIIGADIADPDGLWITELWTDKEAHAASLKLPSVQAAIAKGRPMIAGFGTRAEFLPT
jgi:quinol monooxygenase YgiN